MPVIDRQPIQWPTSTINNPAQQMVTNRYRFAVTQNGHPRTGCQPSARALTHQYESIAFKTDDLGDNALSMASLDPAPRANTGSQTTDLQPHTG